jgi:hypothetical protein
MLVKEEGEVAESEVMRSGEKDYRSREMEKGTRKKTSKKQRPNPNLRIEER